MLFVVDKIFNLFTRPSDLTFFCLLAASALLLLGRRRAGIGIVLALTALTGILWLLPVDDWLLAPLEQRFAPSPSLPRCIDGVLMLGGGENRRPSTAWQRPILQGDFGGFIEVARIARQHPEAIVLFSGFGSDDDARMTTEAEIARGILLQLGVKDSQIKLEERSRDTWQNFVYSREIAKPRVGGIWVLVTSAAHMPRSIGIARHLSWPMIADPTDQHSVPEPHGFQHPEFSDRLLNIRIALHEWEGLIGYRAEGRIDSLLPGPAELEKEAPGSESCKNSP